MANPATTFGFYRGPEFLELPRDPQTWLIQPIVPTGGFVNVYGQPKKARKSYLALGMAWAVSTGQASWLGFPIRYQGPVLYLQVDTPHALWADRIQDIISGGYDFSNVWLASTQTAPYPFDIGIHEDQLQEMIAQVTDAPVMIVCDTAASMHTLDENSNQEMGLFMHAVNRAVGQRMAKILVSHDSKSGGAPPGGGDTSAESVDHSAEGGSLMRGNRGASAVAGAADTVIKVSPKGYLYYQGRAVGEEHKKLRFDHVHNAAHPCPHKRPQDCMGWMWWEDLDPLIVEARRLLLLYKSGSERSLARVLARSCKIEEERARAIIRRQREKLD